MPLGEIPIVQCPIPHSSVTLYASVLQHRYGMVYPPVTRSDRRFITR